MSDIADKFKYGAAALWDFLTSKTGAFIIGVSAIAVGWYQFYISRPILKYDTEALTFISSQNDNDYRVQVKGREYKDLYQTRVYLYNVGASALSGKDVSKPGHDPIQAGWFPKRPEWFIILWTIRQRRKRLLLRLRRSTTNWFWILIT